jgi:hypothetical protein
MADDHVLSALLDREPIFHRRHHGTSRAALDAMMAPGFFEVGASGRVYSREYVLETCLERYKYPETLVAEVTEPKLRHLADECWQLYYVLIEPDRVTRRSTIWRRVEGDWQIVYHQGTIVT